jgi:hypothetical protein
VALAFTDILARFPSAKRVGQEYEAYCPVHERGHGHKTPSLHLREGQTHVAVLLCRTQRCSTKSILDAVGLTWDDISQVSPKKDRFERVHVYRDADGQPLYRVIVAGRDADGKKIVWQERYDADHDHFEKGMTGVRVVPYRLNDLAGHARVCIAEGERKCDRLWRIGLPATCNVGGAKKWRESDTAALKAAGCQRAVLLPDKDETGIAHMALVATSLTAAGIQAVTLQPFEDVGEKGDVDDWLAKGHTAADLEALILAAGAQVAKVNGHGLNGHALVLLPASAILDFVPDQVQWIVNGYLAARSVCLLIARPKVGKTTLARALAVAIAQGRDFLGAGVQPGAAWYLAFEGRFEDHRTHFLQLGLGRGDPLQFHCAPATATAVEDAFASAIAAKPRVIIVDTLQKFLRAQDMDAYSEMSLQMGKIEQLAHESTAAVVALHHMGKYGDDDSGTGDTPLGSTAIEGGVDDTWMLRRYPRYRTLAIRGRHKDLDEHLLLLDDDGSLRLGEDREAAEVERFATELLEALGQSGQALTEAGWMKLVRGKALPKYRALRALVSDRRVRQVGDGTRGKPFRYLPTGAEFEEGEKGPTPGDLDFEV